MNSESNEHIKRKRKMLLFLPLLVLPFLALAFWALGGGKKDSSVLTQEGINGELPGAKIANDTGMDKMAFYDKAEQSQQYRNMQLDSSRGAEGMQPGSGSALRNTSILGNTMNPYDYQVNQHDYSGNGSYTGNTTENRIRNRLQAIQQQLKDSETGNRTNADDPNGNSNNYQLDKLNGMLQNSGQSENDPEMNQLQGMMKRIYDIQHPEIVKEELRKQSTLNRGVVYPINLLPEEMPVTLLLPQGNDSLQRVNKIYPNGFYGLEDYSSNEVAVEEGIEAIVQDNSSVVNGATVKMRLLQDIFINGNLIPKGAFVNGVASLSNDRVIIEINSILHNNSVFSVKLSAYDMDGMEGIYVQGSINRTVSRQSGDNAIQSIGIGSLDPSIGAQATAAGIETAKTLLSKKTKLVKVFIKAGHKVLLKDNNKQ